MLTGQEWDAETDEPQTTVERADPDAPVASLRNTAGVLTDRSGRRDIAGPLPTHARGQPEALAHVAGIERLPQNVALSDTLTVGRDRDDRGPSFEPVPAERVLWAT